ncbi:MAG: tRNA (guanosine(37)-N1)-methyltransferase TrmD [Pseudomonadota bacterium]
MPWQATVLTLFPEVFPGPLDASVLGRARAQDLWALDTVNIRDFADNDYGSVDAPPYGGGAGLVMRVDLLAAALDSIDIGERPIILLSPRGAPFDQERAAHYAGGPGVVLLCGRYEGVDERLARARPIIEVSIGDYVLAGGEIGAMVLIEACARLIPGVIGSAQSLSEESYTSSADPNGPRLLEYPQYTKPREFEGLSVPEVLLSGDHQAVARWRREQAEAVTKKRRPDLIGAGHKKTND